MDRLFKKYSIPVMFSGLYLVSAFAFSFIAYILNLSDEALSVGSFVITIIFILLSAIFTAKKAQSKGWLAGMTSGVVFTAVIILISILLGAGNISFSKFMIRLPLYIFISFIGGIMGINLK